MIGPDDLVARLRRLDALARGLARELALWQDTGSPLLYPERKAYLDAVRDDLVHQLDAVDVPLEP